MGAYGYPGVYAPAYTWLLQGLGETGAALAVLDTAFSSPIDPAFAVACDGNIQNDVLRGPKIELCSLLEQIMKYSSASGQA